MMVKEDIPRYNDEKRNIFFFKYFSNYNRNYMRTIMCVILII